MYYWLSHQFSVHLEVGRSVCIRANKSLKVPQTHQTHLESLTRGPAPSVDVFLILSRWHLYRKWLGDRSGSLEK